MMFRENVEGGTILWNEGDEDPETFHIVLRGGPVREVKDGETVRKLSMGDELGGEPHLPIAAPSWDFSIKLPGFGRCCHSLCAVLACGRVD